MTGHVWCFGRLYACVIFGAFMGLMPVPSKAQVSEQQYLAERDTARTALRKAEAQVVKTPSRSLANRIAEDDKRALASLAKKLRALIGPIEIKGWQDQNTMRPETLTTEMGSTALDSLVFGKAPDQMTSVMQVSTETLLDAWLANWQQQSKASYRGSPIPAQIASALRSDNFYTFAVNNDAAAELRAEIKLKKHPEAKHVVAVLMGRTQDAAVILPDNLIVTAVQGGLVFIAEVPLKTKFVTIEECRVPEGDEPPAEYKKCFAANAPKYKAYIAAEKQAQELYDSFPLGRKAQP